MKKLLLSSIVLFIFSLSILIFQISCKKSAKADQPQETTSAIAGKILYMVDNGSNNASFWTANYDGTDKQKLNITLPSGYNYVYHFRISPDGKKIIIGFDPSDIYSCNIDGSDMKKVIDGSTAGFDLY